MNKYAKLAILAIIPLLLALTTISVSAYNYYPLPSSSYGSSNSYSETPGFTIAPKETRSSNSNYLNQNFDSSSYAYDYRGPMFERTTSYSDDLLIDRSSDSGFFSSDVNDIFHRTITATTKEKYVGATESLYMNNQNRQTSSGNTNANSNYNGGMTWGKARLFDAEEYSNSGYGNYYYRPLYDSSTGGFNWRY